MKVLIADRLAEFVLEGLRQAGMEVVSDPELAGESLARAIADVRPEVLVVRGTRVTAPMLEAAPLRLVVRAGAGYNTIDVPAATACGIRVANCPGMNAHAVAELVFGLIIALDRRIPENVADLKQGRWNKAGYSSARGLFGRTLGLIGMGRIGREVAVRARAFGMPVVAWSRSLTPERANELGAECKASPLAVAEASDVVSVHVALSEGTRRLIGKELFEAMRPGTIFINTSRAEVVDEDALAWAVKGRAILAGLDVFDGEPQKGRGKVENGLFRLDGVIGTHHIGGATAEAQQAIAHETLRVVWEFHATGVAPNTVN